MNKCILCDARAVINRQDSASRTIYNCQNCGVFVISDLAEKEVKSHAREIMSFLARRTLLPGGEILLISFEKANLDKCYLQLTVEQIVNLFPKTFIEQMDMALKNLDILCTGGKIRIEDLKYSPLFYLRESSIAALSGIIRSLKEAGLIDVEPYGEAFFPCGVTVSGKGRDRLSALSADAAERSSLLVCASHRDKKINEAFLQAVKKASHEHGLHVYDISSSSTGAKIGNTLIASIKSSRTVVCDLTEPGGEAYFVAAFAKALNKVCVLTCNKSAEADLLINEKELNVVFWEKQDKLYLELINVLKARL